MTNSNQGVGGKLSSFQFWSIVVTVLIGVLLAFAAWLSYRNQYLFVLAFSVGGLGGLVHEIVQNFIGKVQSVALVGKFIPKDAPHFVQLSGINITLYRIGV